MSNSKHFLKCVETVVRSGLFTGHINTAAFERVTFNLCLNMLTAVYIMAGNVADFTVMFKCAHSKILMSTAVVRVSLLTAVTMSTTVRVSTFHLVPSLRLSGLSPPLPLHRVTI